MNRSTLRSFKVVLASAVVSLWPLAAGAQPAPAASMTADQVRDQATAHLVPGYGPSTRTVVDWRSTD